MEKDTSAPPVKHSSKLYKKQNSAAKRAIRVVAIHLTPVKALLPCACPSPAQSTSGKARGKTVRPTTSPVEAHVSGVPVRGTGLDRATNAAPRRNQIVGSNEPRNNENAAGTT